MERGKLTGWMVVTLVCVVLIVAAAVIITMLAVSGKEQAGNGNGQAGSVLPQTSGTSQPSGGGAKTSGTNVATTSTNDKSSGGQSGGSNPATTPDSNDLSNLTYDQIVAGYKQGSLSDLIAQPVQAYSMDEYQLLQAELAHIKGIAGTTDGFEIVEVRISQVDPAWGRVIVNNQAKNVTSTTYFHKQGGSWTYTYNSSGKPSDI